MQATDGVPTPERIRQMSGGELRNLRLKMGMEKPEFHEWRAKLLGEEQPDKSAFTHPVTHKPLWLKDTQNGSAFIVLGGPSLKSLDLSKLNRRGIWTLAVNNAAAYVRPNAMVHVDEPYKFHDSIWRDPQVMKFCPWGYKDNPLRRRESDGTFIEPLNAKGDRLTARQMPNVVLYNRSPCFNPDTYLSETDINWGVSKKWYMRTKRARVLNSMFAAVKICHTLGFRIVYLLGCDFCMDAVQPYAFAQRGDAGKAASNNHAYTTMNAMFHELRPRFDAAGFHVYNTNATSGLTAFEYVRYDEAIRAATEHVQQSLVLDGWYEKFLGKAKGE